MLSSLTSRAKVVLRRVLPANIYRGASCAKRACLAWVDAKVIKLRIWRKWCSDRRHLPLKQGHWELYKVIHQSTWSELGDFPDLVQPRDLNDRVHWLKLFDQFPEKIRCADKLAAREYIRERGCSKYLTEIYQVHDNFESIDFDGLPPRFVIKTNHESGKGHVLVPDKSSLDMDSARERITTALERVYGYETGEWHYAGIAPVVYVEEYIDSGHDWPPADYRFHCVNGRVVWMQNTLPSDDGIREVNVDRQGRPMGKLLYQARIYCNDFKKPLEWEEMCGLAEVLSQGWKYVRVDMFLNCGRIYAGELTFAPFAGLYAGDGQKQLGSLLNFDRTTFKPPIYQELPGIAQLNRQ